MTTKNRIAQLEKRKRGADEDNKIQVFILNEGGGAWTSDANGKHTEYTAAEYSEHLKQCAARGEKIIHVPSSRDGDA